MSEEMKKACTDGDIEKVKELLKNSPSLLETRIEYHDEAGDEDYELTPLLIAVAEAQTEVVKFLLEAKANTETRTFVGSCDVKNHYLLIIYSSLLFTCDV